MENNKKNNEIFLDPEKLIIKPNDLDTNSSIICKLCKGIVSSPIELFCNHVFCSHCLDNWSIQLNDKCPTCNKVIYKKADISENIKNILNDLQFSENGNIFLYKDYIKHLTFGQNINLNAGPLLDSQENNNNGKIYKCNLCGTEYNDVIENAKNEIEEKNKKLTEELRKIFEYKRKLQGDIYQNKHNQEMPESTLIDKCPHFWGNYKPVFECCNTAYGCYICHDENEGHDYQISKKVICLMCACIYEGNECPKCKVKQCYEKKEK